MNSTNNQQSFNPQQIEARAHAHWTATDAYTVTEKSDKPLGKFYACSMLPYPSGKLHMGHVRNYTINDMLTRQLRMKGYNVLMPMGWDAFGLPAENAALKNKVPPAKWTYDNIAYMKKQMQAMGLAIDWSREVATCDPSYYKWNQWLFLKMLEKGIAYRKTQIVNWDPVDMTVLANEQVIDGKGWRTGAVVEKREIPGYYLNITAYAQELLDHAQMGNDKATLTGWPDKVRLMQENWIGKSEGVRFAFTHDIKDASGALIQDGKMYVFTTRADTIMGVTFCAVAPEHPLAVHAASSNPKIAAFIEECKKGGTTEAELAAKEKEGMPLGLTVTHPLTGDAVDVWVGNYVLMSYGDGAVMGVPAHDERDFAFANKYGIAIKQVIARTRVSVESDAIEYDRFDSKNWKDWYAWKSPHLEEPLVTTINSDKYSGLPTFTAIANIATDLAKKGLGELKTTWRLRDWGISRQRYWGTPIPIIYCPEHGAVPVPEKDLPVVLPQDLVPDGSGNPLNKCESFLKVKCPTCGKDARRETDTMDTFVDSSWYVMRYCNPDNAEQMVDARNEYWMQGGVDQYIGGIEHAILHLLYARFWTKVMRDVGLTKIDEPFKKLLCQGMVLNEGFYRTGESAGKRYYWAHELDIVRDDHAKVISAHAKEDGKPVTYEGWTTMSKSKNNGVDPQDLIEKYGADTARIYMMFTAPPEATLEWNDQAVEGSFRFLKRVWSFSQKHMPAVSQTMNEGAEQSVSYSEEGKKLRFEMYSAFKQADFDYARMQYNTVVSAAMKMLNTLEATKLSDSYADRIALSECTSLLLATLYPVCPHITSVLWQDFGFAAKRGDILDAPWPVIDESALQQDEIELMLQINGKLRGAVKVSSSADRASIEATALATEAFMKQAAGAAPKKVIVVPGRLVNIVV